MIKKLFFTTAILAFSIASLQAQALIQKDFRWTLKTNDGFYPAIETMAVFTPSGNILHKQEFMVAPDDGIIPPKGVNKITFTTRVLYKGVLYEMVNVQGKVFPDGHVFIVFHLNGSGVVTPNKSAE